LTAWLDAGCSSSGSGRLRNSINSFAVKLARRDHWAAIDRARRIVSNCEKAVERAGKGVDEAKTIHADLVAKAMVSGDEDGVAGGTGLVIAAEALSVQPLGELEAARAALQRLQAQQTDVEDALALAEGNITAAINSLLAPRGRIALEELRELDAQVAPRLALLKFVLEVGTERGPHLQDDVAGELRAEEAIRRPLESLRREVNNYFAARIGADVQAGMRVWAQSREALRTDPDAPLPGAGAPR
jgi:hypothetical protein